MLPTRLKPPNLTIKRGEQVVGPPDRMGKQKSVVKEKAGKRKSWRWIAVLIWLMIAAGAIFLLWYFDVLNFESEFSSFEVEFPL